jgi:putative ABC transport system permease protein
VSALLERLLGRLPIGWLQLAHNRARLAAALAGVAFADVLVLMQLGFLGALVGSIALPYRALDADILVSSSDANTLGDGSPIPRQRLFEALAVEGVGSATPLYHGRLDWKQADGTVRALDVFGVEPSSRAFRDPAIARRLPELAVADTALLDEGTRNVDRALMARIARAEPRAHAFELKNRTITVLGTFRIGGGFAADGALVVSDQTFLRLFPQRAAGAPSHVLVKLAPGASAVDTVRRLAAVLPDYDTRARTISDAIARDQAFQTTQRPIGLVFGFGVVIGVLVGIIIVYQVLSTDVADHLEEYATFKAIGYGQRFLLGIVFEEAALLALMGFVPGFLVALGLYAAVAALTGLPVEMTAERAALVLGGTLAMCALSGAIATRRLARADPADLF